MVQRIVMKFAICCCLLTGLAWANSGTYTIKNLVATTQDITSMTATANAWKVFAGNPVCAAKTLEIGKLDNSVSCMGANNGPPYTFNQSTKQWDAHPEMGTAIAQLVVLNWGTASNPAVIYSLQSTSYCTNLMGSAGGTTAWYDFFAWNPSTNKWTQPHAGSCMQMANVDYKGGLTVVGWDGNNHITALFQSSTAGSSWTLWSDSWSYVNMFNDAEGCALANAKSIWVIATSQGPTSYPALPSGTAAGCLITQDPYALMAWNTAGQTYVWTEANPSWKAVTGINLQRAYGITGYFIFGEDAAGKPYHWNVNAPAISATYSGQWAVTQGCPTYQFPCKPTPPVAQHQINSFVRFSSGHGLDGKVRTLTGDFNKALAVFPIDMNPLCDPFVDPTTDTECQGAIEGDAECLQSGTTVDSTNDTFNWGVSTAIQYWLQNAGGTDPTWYGTTTLGRWKADVESETVLGCVNTPVCAPKTDYTGNYIVTSYLGCSYFSGFEFGQCDENIWELYFQYIEGKPSPWVFYTPWISRDGVVSCGGTLPGLAYWNVRPPMDCN